MVDAAPWLARPNSPGELNLDIEDRMESAIAPPCAAKLSLFLYLPYEDHH